MPPPRANGSRKGWAKRRSADHFAAVSTRLDKVADSASRRRGCSASGIGSADAIPSGRRSGSACHRHRPRKFQRISARRLRDRQHFREAPLERNIPVLMGLISVWHRNILGYATHGVIPYDQRLGRFPAYLQQLQMESNGKHVQLDGSTADTATGPVVWGEPGTNGQHAFFQLIHQGTEIIPLDLLVAATPTDADGHHHDLLVANCLAQGQALIRGRTPRKPRRSPTSRARARPKPNARAAQELFRQPSDEHVPLPPSRSAHARAAHRPLRAQGVHRGAVWDIDPFDQWGVELGKELALSLVPIVSDAATGTNELDASTAGLVSHMRALRGAEGGTG